MLFPLQHITIGAVDVKRPVVKDDVKHMKNYAVENEVLREYLSHFCTDGCVWSFLWWAASKSLILALTQIHWNPYVLEAKYRNRRAGGVGGISVIIASELLGHLNFCHWIAGHESKPSLLRNHLTLGNLGFCSRIMYRTKKTKPNFVCSTAKSNENWWLYNIHNKYCLTLHLWNVLNTILKLGIWIFSDTSHEKDEDI